MLKASAFLISATAVSILGGAPTATVPTGATIERSGFATVETAPVTPGSRAKRDTRPQGEAGFYALDNGISQAEAMKRIAEQQRVFPEFEKLLVTLRAREK